MHSFPEKKNKVLNEVSVFTLITRKGNDISSPYTEYNCLTVAHNKHFEIVFSVFIC